ncbi:MAG TPA: patatin-like phospholipase family protein [Vicinamibacterales bacterium]
MITPDSPDRLYSTRLRTALVLTGSGTAGAYQAGVLRALHEAGIRIDLVAGRGVGVIGAMFAAMDGAARLWDENGVWRGSSAHRFYRWRRSLRVAGWALAASAAILALPIALLAVAAAIALAGMILTFVGFGTIGSGATALYSRWVETLFAPTVLPTIVPRLAVLALLVAVGAALAAIAAVRFSIRAKRRSSHGLVGRVLGGPLAAAELFATCTTELWNLIRGAAPLTPPPTTDLGRRYVDLVTENLGQPGFRELLLTVHDMDARRDLVFALLAQNHRARFFTRPGPDGAFRAAEAFDLGGVAREHALDALSGALAMPLATEPHLVTFAPEGPWRGETHRICDRPGGLARLLEEVAAAGAEQVIVATALPPQGGPHELSSERGDLRGHAADSLAAFEAAGLRDVLEQWTGRFAGLFVIRPPHNPLGPLDFDGVYDERSDRTHTLAELVDRGYEDAYRQFIEPVVAASGDRLETVQR